MHKIVASVWENCVSGLALFVTDPEAIQSAPASPYQDLDLIRDTAGRASLPMMKPPQRSN